MKRKKIVKKIQKYTSDIKDKAIRIVAGLETIEDDIHDMRKTYKKLRAILRATDTAATIESIKSIYHTAGEVRDLQLHSQAICAYFEQAEAAEYYLLLQKRIDQQTEELQNQLQDFSFDVWEEQILTAQPEGLKGKELRNYLDKLVEKADHNIIGNPSDEDLHTTRKYLKDVLYCMALLKPAHPKDAAIISLKKDLSTLATMFGDYNDYYTRISRLSDAERDPIPHEEKQVLADAIHKLVIQKHHLHTQMVLQFRLFYNEYMYRRSA